MSRVFIFDAIEMVIPQNKAYFVHKPGRNLHLLNDKYYQFSR